MNSSKCLRRLAGSAPENHQEKSLESDEALFRNAAGIIWAKCRLISLKLGKFY